MDIDREVKQYVPSAETRVEFCLDMLEEAEKFGKGVDWHTTVVGSLTIEEMIGALVSAGQYIKETEKWAREEDEDEY